MQKSDLNQNITKRKSKLLKKILFVLIVAVIIALMIYLIFFAYKSFFKDRPTVNSVKKSWAVYDYQKVYDQSRLLLQTEPFNNTLLTYHGYSCFYLSISQNDTSLSQKYIDECIVSLRKASYSARENLLPQIEYMLGKAYFYKSSVSSYYYSDLSVKYLLDSLEKGFKADDIAEYLGLNYATLGMTRESLSSFTEALIVRESDFLLLSIAEQYYKSGEFSSAKQYLYRIINQSESVQTIIKSQVLLGTIYIEENDLESALNEFNAVLKIDENSADAHYQIGVIYEKQGNIVKARSEWRNALKIQANHPGALQKLSER